MHIRIVLFDNFQDLGHGDPIELIGKSIALSHEECGGGKVSSRFDDSSENAWYLIDCDTCGTSVSCNADHIISLRIAIRRAIIDLERQLVMQATQYDEVLLVLPSEGGEIVRHE